MIRIFPEMLAGATPIGGGHSLRGRGGMGGYTPAHYMYISPDGKAESISRPVTYFYKN
jgi:hypothetical protein